MRIPRPRVLERLAGEVEVIQDTQIEPVLTALEAAEEQVAEIFAAKAAGRRVSKNKLRVATQVAMILGALREDWDELSIQLAQLEVGLLEQAQEGKRQMGAQR